MPKSKQNYAARNHQIRVEFWQRYDALKGRHKAKTGVVLAELAEKWFLSENWLYRLVFAEPRPKNQPSTD